MQKLCCFPCSETPSIDVDVKCISTCCASSLENSLNQESQAKGVVEKDQAKTSEQDEDYLKASCCCANVKRQKSNPIDQCKTEVPIQDE